MILIRRGDVGALRPFRPSIVAELCRGQWLIATDEESKAWLGARLAFAIYVFLQTIADVIRQARLTEPWQSEKGSTECAGHRLSLLRSGCWQQESARPLQIRCRLA